MSRPAFSRNDLNGLFSARNLAIGQNYAAHSAVRGLQVSSDGRYIAATVQGQAEEAYTVKITVAPGRSLLSGGLSTPEIDADCTCPVGWGCKHGAAVCLAALEPAAGQARRPVQVDTELEHWLDDLSRAGPSPLPDAAGQDSIFYLVDTASMARSAKGKVVIRPVISRALKKGGFQPPREMRYQHWLRQAGYMTAEDKVIGTLINSANPYGIGFESPPADVELSDLVLTRIIATGRCFLKTLGGLNLKPGPERAGTLGWSVEADGFQTPAILAGDAATSILPASRPWYVETATGQAGPVKLDVALSLAHKFLAGPRVSAKTARQIASGAAPRTMPDSIAPPRVVKVKRRDAVRPVAALHLSARKHGKQTDYLGQITFLYDGHAIDPGSPGDSVQQQEDDGLLVIPRDREVEGETIRLSIDPTGLVPVTNASGAGYGFATDGTERGRWIELLHRTVPQLRSQGWRVTVDDEFVTRFAMVEADDGDDSWEADLREQQQGAWWFSLELGIMVEGQRVALLPLLVQALRRLPEPSKAAIETLAHSGTLYVDLPDGRPLALPFERVRDILTTLVELYDQPLNPDGSMTVPLDLATALSRIDAATRMRWLGGAKLRRLMERLKNFEGLASVPVPEELKATLRPYQQQGLDWLQFLREYGLAGILADDMGLGKTVQALAHILVEKNAGRMDKPCLIVCPTSLIPNWQDEAAKFAPDLKILSLHGSDRAARFTLIDDADIVLSTYPLLSRDEEILLNAEWHMVVLDEAQAIKNPTSQVTQLACGLKARHRICLTGTPVENHLGEAWAQFAFLMPGMLGTHKEFVKRFRTPIEKLRDADRQVLLARRLKPFILRRTKNEVAKELPPKTEIVRHVEFAGPQRDLYETLRLTMHDKVRQAVEEKGFNRSRIVILDALLKLRQACCDPRLVRITSVRGAGSAKLDNLMEMLPEMIEEGRRILLFSQFTSMLDLIKPELDKVGLQYVEIRGDTTDRKTPVKRFQNREVPLFLISLKAGGTGLNLTAADTVIHYDPWWNPAVEQQATDRAHRIGQDKPVFVYKFIVRDTVEERILDLQNRKRELSAAILEERPDATAAFEASDIDFLFREAS